MEEKNSDKKKEKENQSYLAVVKESFIGACLNTTAHGLPNIFRNEMKLLKVVWFLMVLGGLGAALYFISSTVTAFFEYKVSVSSNRYLKSLEIFPAVTFCNLNPFDSSDSETFKYLEYNLESNNVSATIIPTNDQPAIYLVKQAAKILKATVFSDLKTEKISSLGFSLDTMLISCYFNGVKCNTSDFYEFTTFEYGSCYTFNSNSTSLKMTSKYGPSYGLKMELFTGIPGTQDYYMEKRGVLISVHNSSHTPLVQNEGIKVPVGFLADISVDRTFYFRLPSPFSDCRKDITTKLSTDSNYYNKTVDTGDYSKSLCDDICLQNEFIIPKCNCNDPELAVTDSTKSLCKSLSELNCAEEVRSTFDSSDLSERCYFFCPTECDTEEFETKMFFADYPTKYYYDVVSTQPNLIEKFSSKGKVSFELFKESVVMVNVFYNDLSYTLVEETQAVTIEDVFGVVGGQLGLFLGCSILTLLEPIEFIMVLLKKTVHKKNIQKRIAT